MKHLLGHFALLAVAALWAGNSAAQSDVTIFGTIDLYVGHAKAGPRSVKRLDEGGHGASRLGFRGSEDLGGGLQARFLLEGGIAPDTGSGTLPGPGFSFTRQSYVGLAGPWGSIDLGRMYTPTFFTLFRADPFGLNAVFSPMLLVGATDAQPGLVPFPARSSNMVRYRTPGGAAWFADVAVAPSEGAVPSFKYGLNAGYAAGPAYLAYGMQKTRAGTVSAPASSTNHALSGAYGFSGTRLSASVVRNATSQPGVPKAMIYGLGASHLVAPTLELSAGAVRRNVEGSSRGQLAWTLGLDHHLSKRTALYGRALQLENRGLASATLAQVPVTANSGENVRVLAAGVRHHF